MLSSIIIVFFLVLAGAIAQQEAVATTSSTPESMVKVAPLPSPAEKENKSVAKDLATQATAEKLPQVSAAILRAQLQQEQNPEEKQKLTLRLGEVLVIEHRPEEALVVLNSKDLAPDPMISFWKAQAFLALGKASEAEPLLQSILMTKNALSKEYLEATSLALARANRALGKGEEALKLVEEIPTNSSLALLALEERCSLLFALNRSSEVESLLKDQSQLLQQQRLLYLYALAAWQRGDHAEALRRFTIGFLPNSTAAANCCVAPVLVFSRPSSTLRVCAPETPCTSLASASSARSLIKTGNTESWTSAATVAGIANCEMLLQKPAEAQALLEKYIQENPNTPLLPELMKQLEELYIVQHNKEVTTFYKWANDNTQSYRASYAMLPLARMMERQGHVSKSDILDNSFLKKFPNHPLFGEACLELAQSKFNQGDPTAALSLLQDQASFSPAVRARMAFLRGLAESMLKHPERAEQEFRKAESFDSTLAADAQYNQMLLRFVSDSSKEHDFASSQQQKTFKEAIDQTERKEYLEVLHSDHGDQASASIVIKKARAFLAAHPHSSFANEVRMKLGEALLKKGLVRDARLELENVGHAESNSELGRQALLLAARAASHSMDPKSIDDAIMILEQVAQTNKGSDDAWQARLEQAALKNVQALPQEAITIDDQILATASVPPEIRYIAQMAKGDTLSGLGTKDPNNYRAAIATWRSLAETPDVPPRWRNQALCKIGLIEEKLGENDIALAVYYEAMKTPRLQEPEQLWHDKAAFEAGRLLEARHQWNEAIQLYQQIINEGGARAEEARARVSKLRLENFLWN